jgi:hypothetical protein
MATVYKVDINREVIDLNLTKQDFVVSLSRTGGQGAQGLSAYQIAVNEGFVGTEEQWIESLKGEQGDPYESAAAQAATEAARDAAISAKNVAVSSADSAEQSETNAAVSAQSALQSKNEASAFALTATTKANEAAASASAALTSANNAEDAYDQTVAAAIQADQSAISSAASATSANNSKISAASSEANSLNSANSATVSANSASSYSLSAAASAASAANSQSSASNSQTAASNSALNAAARAQDAENSSISANQSSLAAANSASLANSFMLDAQNSKISAEDSAYLSSQYADTANTHKLNAQSAASQSIDYAGFAATSASNAAASEVEVLQNTTTVLETAITVIETAQEVEENKSDVELYKQQVEALYDSFDDRYLGAKTTAPVSDNDGNPLLVGALYYFVDPLVSANNQLKIWDGSNWDNAAFNTTNAVTSFNTRTGVVVLNQTDITSALNYVPANPASLSTVATSGSYNDLFNKPVIPTDVDDLTDSTGLLFDKQYSSLQGLPQNLSNFTNDQDYQNTVGVQNIINNSTPAKALQDTGEPLGFINRSHSSISFLASTREFKIEPNTGANHVSYDIWTKGVKRTYTGINTVTIPNTTGLYYIYFDANGVLQYRTSYFNWESDCMVSYVYWNATVGQASFVADERHGVVLDWQTHEYLHRTRGAAFANGFAISGYNLTGNGSSNTHAQISLSGGTFFDEDLEVQITHSLIPVPNTWEQYLTGVARLPVFYLSGTSWIRDNPTDYPLKTGTLRPQYNYLDGSSWATADIAEGRYGTSWIVATNNLTYPVIVIIGQHERDLIGAAEALRWEDLNLPDFPIFEFRPLYKLIYQCDKDYTNTPKARMVSILDFRSVISTQAPASLATDHGLLSGLGDDDHLQYVHISESREVTATHNFNSATTFGNKTLTTIARESISGTGDINYNSTTGVISYNGVTEETDPVFLASPAGSITSTQVTNWDTAFGWGDHANEGYSTETYVNAQITALVDSSPETLNTLNELAAALGDDPNFATTTATQIGLKANTADLASVATSGSYNDLTNKPILGTSASKNVSSTGDAASTEVVLGSDTRLSNARTPVAHNQAWSTITSTPTTLAGYGITDAQALDADLTAITNLVGTSGTLKKVSNGIWELDNSNYLATGAWKIVEENGNLYFSVNNVNKMKLDVNGNLDVAGSINSNATL